MAENDIFEKLFGKAPEKGYEFTHAAVFIGNRAICVDWSAKGVGFGGVDFVFSEENGLEIHTECMNKEFVMALYSYLDQKLKAKELVIKELQEDCETTINLTQVNPDFIMAALLTFVKFGKYDPR